MPNERKPSDVDSARAVSHEILVWQPMMSYYSGGIADKNEVKKVILIYIAPWVCRKIR